MEAKIICAPENTVKIPKKVCKRRDIKISNQHYVTFHKRDLPKGIYFIEITTSEKKYLQKIIIH